MELEARIDFLKSLKSWAFYQEIITDMSGSSLNGFLCSRVGACELENVGRRNRDMKEIKDIG